MDGQVLAAIFGAAGVVLAAVISAWYSRRGYRETQSNGGWSLRDVVDRMDRRLVLMDERDNRTEQKLDSHLVQAEKDQALLGKVVRHLQLED